VRGMTMKKIAAVFMVFVLTLVSADTVSAGGRLISENNTYGDFTYSVSAFGDCAIEIMAQLISYHGEAEHLVLPGSVPCNGGKFRVNNILPCSVFLKRSDRSRWAVFCDIKGSLQNCPIWSRSSIKKRIVRLTPETAFSFMILWAESG